MKKSLTSYNRRNFIKAFSTGIATSLLVGPDKLLANSQLPEKYDYIIVGSGAGGGPIACRLAKAGYRVLVIEAGGKKINDNARIPAFHLKSTEDPMYSWDFFVKHYKDKNKHGRKFQHLKDGILYPRAGVLGGCTVHNAMISLYPYNSDWQKIYYVTGDRSFLPSSMRKIYEDKVMQWHHTEQTPIKLALKDSRLLKMFTAAGLEIIAKEGGNRFLAESSELIENISNLDPNSRENIDSGEEGIFLMPKSTKNGKRWSTREYLLETQRRFPNNLFIATDTMVSKLILSKKGINGLTAEGVECLEMPYAYEASPKYKQANVLEKITKKVEYRATREVIISGGAFNSPQLLMLSGIGDKGHLDQMGIETKLHLPGVGKNLQDRYEICVVSELGGNSKLIEDCTLGKNGDPCMRKYNKNPSSSLYGSNGLVTGIKLKSNKKLKDPDLMIFGGPINFTGYFPGYSKIATQRKDLFSWAILKGQTKNKAGTVKLKSKNPFVRPEVNFNYFKEGEKEDMTAMLKGVEFTRKIFDKYIDLRKLSFEFFDNKKEVWPGRHIKSQTQLKNFIKKESWGHHASCSNKMGNFKKDKSSVVGSNFKVHGTTNLRIVDASVFPEIPGLFITVPIYMISEKAAQDILSGN